MSIRIGTRTVTAGVPAFVIAELAWAHDGDLAKAVRIARDVAKVGADALSVHVTSLRDYMVPHYGCGDTLSQGKPASSIYDYLERINLSFEAVAELVCEARAAGLALLLMPNDAPSLEVSQSLSPEAYVLAPACFVDEEFVRALGMAGRPVVLRIGGATLGEIERTLGWLREAGAREFLLLHGFQTYPTRLEETNLRVLPVLSRMFDCPVGLADHLDGGDDLALAVPLLALALGAAALEKHITWDRSERGEDFESALDPERFAQFVRLVRAAEAALGTETLPFSADALKYRQISRKRVVAAEEVAAGTVLAPRHLTCKRSEEGAPADERARFIGRRTKVQLGKDAPLTAAALE